MAKITGEYSEPQTTALLVGSYIDSYFEGTLKKFKDEHLDIFKRDGSPKADYVQAEEIIERIKSDSLFMQYMSGKKQVICTAELFGAKWKIKIDSLCPDKIVDLKIMRSMERVMGRSFVEYWGYDLQLAIYNKVWECKHHRDLETYLAVATKQSPPDIDIIHVPAWHRKECLAEIEKNMPHILAVKEGREPAERCGMCPYCRATKQIKEPVDFELVGFTASDRKIIEGFI